MKTRIFGSKYCALDGQRSPHFNTRAWMSLHYLHINRDSIMEQLMERIAVHIQMDATGIF